MGKVYSVFTRPIRMFNIENRAARVISRKKPVPAPQYKYVERQKEFVDKANPNFLEDHYRKNMQLDQRLKDVFVTSKDPNVTMTPSKDSKPLPQDRFNVDAATPFYYEPIVIPAGKCSLKQAITFLGQHKEDPVTHSVENIVAEYKLDKKIVGDILKYFNLFVAAPIPHAQLDDPRDKLQKEFDHTIAELERKKDKKE